MWLRCAVEYRFLCSPEITVQEVIVPQRVPPGNPILHLYQLLVSVVFPDALEIIFGQPSRERKA